MLKFLMLLLLALPLSGWAAPKIDVKTISMDNIDFKSIEKVCKSLLTENGDMIYIPVDNILLIRDEPEAGARIARFISHTKELLKEHDKDEAEKAPKVEPPPAATKDDVKPAVEAKPEIPEKAPTVYRVIPLGNTDYGTVDEICRSWLSDDGKLLYSPGSNTVIISDTANIVNRVHKFIDDIHKSSGSTSSSSPTSQTTRQISIDDINQPQSTNVIYVRDSSYGSWGFPNYYYYSSSRWPPRPRPCPPHPRPRPRPHPSPRILR